MAPEEVAQHLGLRQIRIAGKQLYACCPLHADRTPSFSMNLETTEWKCHAGCGEGNLFTLLKRLDRFDLWEGTGQGDEYERTTDRTSGSISSIIEQLRWADFLLKQGYRYTDVERDLRDQYDLSPSTAHERVAWLTGKRRLQRDARGRLRGCRMVYCLKLVRSQSPEHRLAIQAEKGRWASRFQVFRSQLLYPEVKYGAGFRKPRIVTMKEMAEDARAWAITPRPPPEIGTWTPLEKWMLVEDRKRQIRLREDVWLPVAA